MTQRIQLDDLIGDDALYEPTLMRMPLDENNELDDDALTHAAAKTAQDILKRRGVPEVEITDEDAKHAQELFMQHLNKVPIHHTALQKPETVLKLEAIVQTYDHRVIQHADQIRFLVTNKLIELSDARDPKIQLKAVELLGKLADVGMFVEKQEITYKQVSDDELKKKLAEKLGLIIDAEVIEEQVMTPEEAFALRNPDVTPLPQTPKITTNTIDMLLNGKTN